MVAEIRREAGNLRAAGRTATLVVASDGEASDGDRSDVARALAPLQVPYRWQLPTYPISVARALAPLQVPQMKE